MNKHTNIWEVAGQCFPLIRTRSFTLPWVVLGREKSKLDAGAQQSTRTGQGHPKVRSDIDRRTAFTPLAVIAKSMWVPCPTQLPMAGLSFQQHRQPGLRTRAPTPYLLPPGALHATSHPHHSTHWSQEPHSGREQKWAQALHQGETPCLLHLQEYCLLGVFGVRT